MRISSDFLNCMATLISGMWNSMSQNWKFLSSNNPPPDVIKQKKKTKKQNCNIYISHLIWIGLLYLFLNFWGYRQLTSISMFLKLFEFFWFVGCFLFYFTLLKAKSFERMIFFQGNRGFRKKKSTGKQT